MSRPSHQRSLQLEVLLAKCGSVPRSAKRVCGRRCGAVSSGVRFRRQAVIGDSIVDFLAPAVSLVVEVDGGYHSRRCGADARRDRCLERAGYRVLRFEAQQVMADLPGVLALILEQLG
jgi:very-short-patch-repair endonuclease